MQGKKTNVPMTHIQERAPEDKWMKDAKVPPTPVNPSTPGVVDAAELYRARKAELDHTSPTLPPESEAFDGVNAAALERRNAAAAAAESKASKLEAEKKQLEEKLALTDKALTEAKDGIEASRSKMKSLKKEVTNEKSKVAQATKEVEEAQAKLKELEEMKKGVEVEVEVYPDKVVIDEVTNVTKKGNTVIIKTMVVIDDESVPLTIRAPYKKLKAALDKVEA